MMHEAYMAAEVTYRQDTLRAEACARRMRRRARFTAKATQRTAARRTATPSMRDQCGQAAGIV
jgi:hypothetical protein